MFSTENIAIDVFRGCFVVTCTLFTFIGLVWLREQIIHGGGPEWLERDDVPPVEPNANEAANGAENEDDNNNNNINNNDEEHNNNNNNNFVDNNLAINNPQPAPQQPQEQEPPQVFPIDPAEPPQPEAEEPVVEPEPGNKLIIT